ncbi:TonB-dependent receptor [Lysobacter pythonis]|uniref:TonB-dependent receptor n=1 Tax=Solilutibacter pythonis TaxID=2483112 RepID=A0A3M2HG14_9GAMM|nr:TonB-dependent receptor [Lysobacter pythonis]RMH88681.1 TonB-dependent receptor [Lysobacter pythonis]
MTSIRTLRRSKLALGLIAAMAAAPVFAQSTSAGIGGQVTNASGQPVAGAEVTITHVESGTVNRATTDASGRYSARGLRVGGPYTITVNKAGEGSDSENNVYLGLDQLAQVNARLASAGSTLDTVVVTGVASNVDFSADNKGMNTYVGADRIDATPQGNRSIDDIARLDPRINVTNQGDGSISLAGLPNRYNNISVDGMSQGDPFGLNANGMPYQGSPISMDAIDAYNIGTSDYDVTKTAVGASINAVTKSGTNSFHGSAYYAFRNAGGMVGKAGWLDNGKPGYKYGAFERNWSGGVTFGGPLVRDRLFFFVSAEEETTTGVGADASNALDPSLGNGPSTSNKVSPGDLQKIIDTATRLGLQPGGMSGAPDFKNRRYLTKFDWNINDAHRASLTLQRTTEVNPRIQGNGSSSIGLNSYWFTTDSKTENASLQLFSDWNSNFSSEVKFSHQRFSQVAGNAINQPNVTVFLGDSSANRGPSVNIGEDQFRHENEIRAKKSAFYAAGTWFAGDHEVKGGLAYETNDIYNMFGRALHGVYTFYGLDNFAAGQYDRYEVRKPAAGYKLGDVAGAWTYKQASVFLQDTWQATDNLSLLFGLRYDMPNADKGPLYNQAFEQAFGYPNNTKLGSKANLLQPRFAFNYQLQSDRMAQLRGGVGLFMTTPPTVWMTNPYQNNGLTVAGVQIYDPATAPFSPDPFNQPGGAGRPFSQVDTIAPGFKLPAAWKTSIGFDYELPWQSTVLTMEAMHVKTKNGIYYQAINIGAPTSDASGTPILMPDGRLQYWRTPGATSSRDAAGNRNPAFDSYSTLLTNTDKGRVNTFTISLDKPMADSWSGRLAATFTDATEVNPGNSSQASSGYRYVARKNANEEVASTSDRSVPLTLKANLTWKHAFFGDYATMVSAFYTGRNGLPYSWVYGNNMNGDGLGSWQTVYIPTVNDPLVSYTGATPQQIQQFHDFIDSQKELRDHRGQIAERNSARYPWVNQLDLAIQQEVPGFMKGHKGILRLDVFNFLNLLNKDWGRTECTVSGAFCSSTRTLANYAGVKDGKLVYRLPTDGNGNYQPETMNYQDSGTIPTRVISRWSLLMTLKYQF